ncbi:MAG: DNA/RNA nuclease SfsA [Chloroflexi bacterium]|nr:DNA/RNA nuclease SfsA [Chloroflexota bacterium]
MPTPSVTAATTAFVPHQSGPGVLITGPTCTASFLRRLSRFSALVLLDGCETLVHVPNSGRMRELLTPGRPCLLAVHPGPGRKTAHDLLMVDVEGRWVGVDARLPSRLVAEALAWGAFPPFRDYPGVRREVRYGASRLDFLLVGSATRCLVEVKNVNRVLGTRAVFPDAPTVRGVRHLQELMAARRSGDQAAVVFIIQRDDAEALSPDEANDPRFSRTLGQAAAAGVALHAWRYRLGPEAITLDQAVPVVVP